MVQQSKDLGTKRVVLLIRRVLHQVRCRKVPDAFHAISVRRLGWPKLQMRLWMRLTPLRRHRGREVPGVLGKQDHVRRRRGRPGNAFKPFKPPLRIARLCTGPMNQGVLRRMLPPQEVPPFPTAIRLHDRRILRITPTLSRLILTNQGPRVQQQHDRAGCVRPFHDFILQDNGAWLLFAGRLPGFNDVGFGVSLNECRRSSPLASYGGPPFIRVATRRPRRNAASARAGCLASRTRPRNRIFSRPSR